MLTIILLMAGVCYAAENPVETSARQQGARQLPFYNNPGQQYPGYHPGDGQAYAQQGLYPQPAYPQIYNQNYPELPQQHGYPGHIQYDPYAPQPQYPISQYGGYYPQQHPQQQGIPQAYYPGQPFLLNPGVPPGNFLYPQQPGAYPIPQQPSDPNIFRTNPYNPGFGAYPNPPPPIEKDAEEIPTNAQQIPHKRPGAPEKKPEKIELDDEIEPTKQTPKKPLRNLLNLKPGQRFFILNGQPLFSNYPGLGQFHQQPERYNQQAHLFRQQPSAFAQGPFPNRQSALQNFFLRNGPITNFNRPLENELEDDDDEDDSSRGILLRDALPLLLHDQVVNKETVPAVLLQEPSAQLDEDANLQSRYYEKKLPFERPQQQAPLFEGNVNPGVAYDYYKYNEANANEDDDDDSVVIDAKVQDPAESDDTEEIEAELQRGDGSSVAQAQPGAIALAGVGGVAAAGPRGTALAGEGGLAVSSPQATAVAGPSIDPEDKPDKKTKPINKQPQPTTKP